MNFLFRGMEERLDFSTLELKVNELSRYQHWRDSTRTDAFSEKDKALFNCFLSEYALPLCVEHLNEEYKSKGLTKEQTIEFAYDFIYEIFTKMVVYASQYQFYVNTDHPLDGLLFQPYSSIVQSQDIANTAMVLSALSPAQEAIDTFYSSEVPYVPKLPSFYTREKEHWLKRINAFESGKTKRI
jgi:hypothetical protein